MFFLRRYSFIGGGLLAIDGGVTATVINSTIGILEVGEFVKVATCY